MMSSDRRLWFRHKCRYCSYLFVSEKDLVYHEASHNMAPDEDTSVTCDSCSAVFDDTHELSRHMNDGSCTSADSSSTSLELGPTSQCHVCRECGEIFHHVRMLYRHYRQRHMTNDGTQLSNRAVTRGLASGSARCTHCGAVFSGAASLKVHLWKAHNLNISQQAEQHGRLLGRSWSQRHIAGHGGGRGTQLQQRKPYKCPMCNWSFKYDFSYHSHVKMHRNKQTALQQMLANTTYTDDPVTPSGGRLDIQLKATAACKSACSCNSSDSVSVMHDDVVGGHQSTDSKCQQLVTGQQDGCSKGPCTTCSPTDQRDVHLVCSHSATDPTSKANIPRGSLQSEQQQYYAVGKSGISEQPVYQFECKQCSFKCQYDFSYMAHLSQHEKLRQLDIDDLQSHLIATPPTPCNVPPAAVHHAKTHSTELTSCIQLLNDVSAGHTQLVDCTDSTNATAAAISYILLCPSAVSNTEHRAAASAADIPDVHCEADTVLCSNNRDDQSQPICNARSQFSDGPDVEFLKSNITSAETMYVISSAGDDAEELQSYHCYHNDDNSAGELCVDTCTDNTEDYTCYYCNSTFNDKSLLQQHIIRLHIH